MLKTAINQTNKVLNFQKQRIQEFRVDMGVDLSQSEVRKVREGSKFLNLCNFTEVEEIIRTVHQPKEEL